MSNIYEKIIEVAKENREKTAVQWKDGTKWKSMTYKKFVEKVEDFAGGLSEIGVGHKTKVAILSENRPEWLIADFAINKLLAISVPIHITSNRSLVEFILNNSNSGFLLVSKNLFEKHFDFLNNWQGSIILFEQSEKADKEKVLTFNDMIDKQGVASNIEENQDYSKEIASIIYTSGTTGDPKGVMLSNENFLFNIESAKKVIEVKTDDVLLSFLPLSHVLERTAGSYVPILSGASIAYAESIQKLQDNMSEVKPSILICVPKIFERIYEKIFFQANSGSELKKKIFFWALKQKKEGIKRTLAKKLVYKKIKNAFGGKLRFAISGGASLNQRIIKFFDNVGVEIVEGYGLTETAPLVSANTLENKKIGSVGKPIPDIDVRIAKDKEIIVKGKNVMCGYWRNDEATREVLDENGWFKTGDMGFLDSDNFLTIIGRKKDIIVLSNGKNIAPEHIEGIINLSTYIEQALVVGHKKSCLTALIVPDYEKIKKEFGKVEDLHSIIKKELDKINSKLHHYEIVKNFKILDKPFTMEKEELTPTLKVRRKIIEAKYEKIISNMYKNVLN